MNKRNFIYKLHDDVTLINQECQECDLIENTLSRHAEILLDFTPWIFDFLLENKDAFSKIGNNQINQFYDFAKRNWGYNNE